jgi:ABC-type glycerol-3-phosphate transport system substrate-binding protein
MNKMPLLATAVAAALSLTACASGQTPAATTGSGNTELTWGMWIGSTADQEAWQKVADQVTADHPDIKVTIQGAPWADYWTKLTTQITSTDAPCIVSIQSLRASQFTEGLVPLDDLIKKNNLDTSAFDAGALKNLTVSGSQYALPYDTGPVVMFYNADMFAKAGATEPKPGWTTADFEAAGAKLSAAGMKLYAQTAEDIFLEGAAQGFNGSTPITADGTVQAADPGYVAALDWLGSLSKAGYALDADGSDGSADDNAFMAGKAATIVEGPWSLIDLSGKVKFKLGIATVPAGQGGGKTVSAGSGFGISKTCKNPDQAFAAITSMTSEKVLGGLAGQGRAFPARTAVQSNWMKKAGDVAQVDTVMTAAQSSSVPAPGSAKSEQLSQLLTQYVPEVLNGKKAAAEVMANIQSQIG